MITYNLHYLDKYLVINYLVRMNENELSKVLSWMKIELSRSC